MIKSGFSYLKLTAVVAVLAITLIGLSSLLSVTTSAQERITTPPREIDLRAKLKDKKFDDGRRVVFETLDSGEKIAAEIKEGKFTHLFLIATDGSEVQGLLNRKGKSTSTSTATCSATLTTTTTTTKRGKTVTTSSSTIVQIPCPGNLATTDTFK